MRSSTYNIGVPCDHRYLLINGRTGAFDVVSSRIGEAVESWDGQAEDRVSTSVREYLVKRGYLTEMTDEEEQAWFKRLATILHNEQLAHVRSFHLIPSYECQLRCPYCFELSLYKKGMPYMERRMTPEVVDLAFAAIEKMTEGLPPLTRLGLFGGEPLSAANVAINEYIFEEGAKRNITFSAITNGVDLEHYRDRLGPAPGKLREIQVSFDGGPAAHNCMRIHPDKRGTFDEVIRSVGLALERGVRVVARVNLDRTNIESVKELSEIFRAKGWTDLDHFVPYAAAIYAKTPERQESKCFNSFDLAEALVHQQAGEPMVIPPPDKGVGSMVGTALRQGGKLPFNPTFCGANTGMTLFDPHGNAYACWDVVGEQHHKIGTFVPELQLEDELTEPWRGRSVAAVDECSRCAYAMFCGGGCEALAKIMKGSFFESFCDGFQANFRRSAREAYADHRSGKAARASSGIRHE